MVATQVRVRAGFPRTLDWVPATFGRYTVYVVASDLYGIASAGGNIVLPLGQGDGRHPGKISGGLWVDLTLPFADIWAVWRIRRRGCLCDCASSWQFGASTGTKRRL